MDYLDLILRWAHIFSAVLLVGGTYFLRFVWFPSTRELSTEERETAFCLMRRPWAMIVMLTTLLLLVSGLVNAVRIIVRFDFSDPYHALVAIKLLLALVLFFVAARVAGRSASAVKVREKIGMWLTINTIVATLLVGLGGYMKLVDRTPKQPTIEQQTVLESPASPASLHQAVREETGRRGYVRG